LPAILLREKKVIFWTAGSIPNPTRRGVSPRENGLKALRKRH